MRSTNGAGRDCETYWELACRRRAGRPLTDEELTVLLDHLRTCPTCMTDAAVADIAGPVTAPGPAPKLDGAARNRWVEEVMRTAARPSAAERRRSRTRIVAAVLAAGVAVVVGVYLFVPTTSDSNPDLRPQELASLFLAAGESGTADRPARAGTSLLSGEEIRVGNGRVGFSLCGGTHLFLGSGSRARLGELRDARCEVRLLSGRLVANAQGLEPGSQLVISTTAGDVKVTGTVFAVETTSEDVEVRVYEGTVEFSAPTLPTRTLHASQALLVGVGRIRSPTPDNVRRDRSLADWFPESPDATSALLDISTASPAVNVAIDGRMLGPAPVTAMIVPGRHVVELRSPDGRAVRDVIDLAVDDRFERGYLFPGPEDVTQAPGAAFVPSTAAAAQPVGSSAGVTPPVHHDPAPSADRSRDAHDRPADVGVAETALPVVEPDNSTAADLLDAARRLRIAGVWQKTAAPYEELTTRFPDTGEARASLVPLGQLRLERLGDAAGALCAFDEYLSRSSPASLAEEASWGRIQALRRLGRTAEEGAALRSFIVAYPASLRIAEAQERLAALEGGS